MTHRYGATAALDAIDLEIPAGRMVGFVGPDGVGKSTVLALISGVRKIQGGTVQVLGGDIGDVRHRTRVCAQIAYMPQGLGRNLYPTLSVIENVDFFGRLFGQSASERKWRIEELLASTGLSPFGDRPAGKLSGGMKQKLGLCCSLMHDPQLLILDEPTTGVDPLSRRQFWELIARMRARRPGLSVLVATAYMDEAEGFDWIVAMDAGKVLSTGTPEQLKTAAGAADLEQAFVAMLPEEKRSGHRTLTIPPRTGESREVAIEARGLTRRFGAFTAVDHITVRIERGEIFGFLGSNGCGKTTTMKMLTGLLPVTEGEALLFGHHVDPDDLDTRRRVGFMSQAFSLYTELTVRQNLVLHGHLFHLAPDLIARRVAELTKRFGLEQYMDELPESLPLGVRQRLSLAVAVIHGPEMLILDEPTSGVDPVARDSFWELLVELSRKQGVTIFISTHFMNEAARCDRISLMHAGRILAQGPPAELVLSRGAATLEQAFISCLEEAVGKDKTAAEAAAQAQSAAAEPPARAHRARLFSIGRLWAYASRESMEIRRDPVRLAFALLAPIILMIVMGYGISFDVEDLTFAVLDQDNSPESRHYLENFRYSRYFSELAPIKDHATMERRLDSGELNLAIEIPPEFGKDLRRGNQPEVGVWVDGAMPFRAETARDYVEGVQNLYLGDLYQRAKIGNLPEPPTDLEVRYLYNQDFESVFAIVPGAIMLLLVLIPSMMTALGVVREKELGSITNLYATPVTRLEFVLGKQTPYVAISFFNFITLVVLSIYLFGVPVKGSMITLAAGAALYVAVTTGLGLFISTFVSSQIAAIFATAIITTLPAIQFSGMMVPVSSLSGGARLMGETFPSAYFQQISLGTMTKAMGFAEMRGEFLALAIFFFIYLLLSLAFLPKQEA